eukprot:6172319-Pleurochrysis_carterae.AAC.2
MDRANDRKPRMQIVCVVRGNLLPVDSHVTKGVTRASVGKHGQGKAKESLQVYAHKWGGHAPIRPRKGGKKQVASTWPGGRAETGGLAK